MASVEKTATIVCIFWSFLRSLKPFTYLTKQILEQMKEREYSTKTWKTHPLHPKELSEKTVNWIFLVDSLNFSFWQARCDSKEKYTVSFKGQKYQGYWSLCACVNRGSVIL